MNAIERKLYGTATSGHTHRVALFLRFLDLPYERINAPAQVRRHPDFRQINAFGQIPVLAEGDLLLTDSNAILFYLARKYAPGSHWLPDEPLQAWAVQRWLSIAAGEVRYGPALARLIRLGFSDANIDDAYATTELLLPFMDDHLRGRSFLATDDVTIADLACYSYVAHSPEGGIDLGPYVHLRAWLSRVENLPDFEPMPWTADVPRGLQPA